MPEYRIKIGTSIGSRLTGTVTHAQFPKCKAGDVGDKFSFQSSCIIIECKRSNIQKKEEIENNPGNTLRVQIMKALTSRRLQMADMCSAGPRRTNGMNTPLTLLRQANTLVMPLSLPDSQAQAST